jgi:lipid-binding SYLF domain-containing protein
VACLCAAGLAAADPVVALGQQQEVQTVATARESLDQFFANPNQSLPTNMLEKAEGVAIFPNMIKGGFILGVNFGRGVLHVRNPDRTWSPPVMVTMGGGSLGFQAGVQSADILLVFATPRSLNGVLQGQKVTLGADASVAAGPVGVQANAGTDARLGAEIYSYARSRGLFLGVSLGGADLSVDNNANSMLYGRFGVTPADVFQSRGIGIRPEVQQLVDDLNYRSRVLVTQAAVPNTGFPPISTVSQPVSQPASGFPQPGQPVPVPLQPAGPLPVAVQPQPAPVQPFPVPQTPVQPAPLQPAPVQPAPVQPPPSAPPLVPVR